jgi:hypothetical protein
MCGGGGDDSASREMIQMQKDESARAAAKEKQRQANIKKGLLDIKYLFEGGRPITKNVAGKFDWKKFTPTGAANKSNKIAGAQVPGLPAGYKYTVIPGVAVSPSGTPVSAASTPLNLKASTPAERRAFLQRGVPNSGNEHGAGSQNRPGAYSTNGAGVYGNEGNEHGAMGSPNNRMTNPVAPAAAPGSWGIVGPDGKIYNIGDDIGTNTVVTTGKTKGWADEFLNKYKQDMINYYQPQVTEQYGKAKDETKYRHAMAGTLSSTANIGNIADLSKQNKINTGEVTSKALEATNQLGDSIDDARAAAEAQVYSTENPTVASTAASRAIKNITAEKPTMTPLGEIFNIATIGAANYLKGSTNASNKVAYGLNPVGRNQKTV